MGISAWVDGKRVLIGNRELMVNHGIEVPSNDYEMRFVKDRKNIIYLSNSGQLSAMFVISYRPNNQTREQLDRMNEKGMSLIINTSQQKRFMLFTTSRWIRSNSCLQNSMQPMKN